MKKNLLVVIALMGSVILYGQGVYQMWGMTPFGEWGRVGSIFNIDGAGNNFRVQYYFGADNSGSNPAYTQTIEYNGKFYGMTSSGGYYGGGVIFEYDPANNIYVNKINFIYTNGVRPMGSLTLVGNKFYGMTSNGGAGNGIIFEWDPLTNILTKKFDFNQSTGTNPTGTLTAGRNKLYGLTTKGGGMNGGTLFEWDPATNIFTKKYEFGFRWEDGSSPFGNLVLQAGKLYGMTAGDGIFYPGTIFEWDPATEIFTSKINFTYSYGTQPYGSLSFEGGKFYGLTSRGGENDFGTIFEWDPISNIMIKKIDLLPSTGGIPLGNLTLSNGKFYGLTTNGGNAGKGVIFEWNPINNVYLKKFDFDCSNGCQPWGTLTLSNNKLYGMTNQGGLTGSGVIFEWDPINNTFTKKLDLNLDRGSYPRGNLTRVGKKFYGLGSSGGSYGKGVIFEWDPLIKKYTKRFDFDGTNGVEPNGSLTLLNGKLYGTTVGDGITVPGNIFEWDPVTNVFSKKFDFNECTGGGPVPQLEVYAGKLYGAGGETIFEWDPSNNRYTIKFKFQQLTGNGATGALTLRNGIFYGTTKWGGDYNEGVLYEWNPLTNVYTTKLSFGGARSSYPLGNLVLKNEKFYGGASGGNNNSGIIFEWDPSTNHYNQFDFPNYNNARFMGNLTASGDKFFGITGGGGDNGLGIIFEWDPSINIFTKKFDFNDTSGSSAFFNNLVPWPSPISNGNIGGCTTFPSVTIDATNNNQWTPITDNDGNAVAEIKANGNNLGIVTASMFINSGAVRKDKNNKYYLDRSITISPQVQPKTPVDVRLYIKATEYEALKNATNIKGKPNAIDSITDVKIYPANSKCSPTVTALGSAVGTVAEKWENDFVLTASVCSLSSFFFAPKTTCAPPVISNMLISTDTLWPPLHSLRGISVAYKTSGDCKCDPVTRWLTVKSNEPISGTGSADKSPDWIIKDANHVYLRAERSDRGTGRIYTITINAQNTAGAVSTYDFTVAVPLTMPAAKAAAMASKQLQEEDALPPLFNCSISPNPTDGYFNLQVETASAEKIEVRVIDMSGALIKSLTASNHQPLRFGNDLKPGVYMIKVLQGQQQQIIKVIKQ